MNSKHTQGPWHSGCFVDSKDGKGCQCTFITADGYCGSIATVSVWNGIEGIADGDNDCPKHDEAVANSKLIAAAPDLLKACIDALWLFKTIEVRGTTIRELQSAIKKATDDETDD